MANQQKEILSVQQTVKTEMQSWSDIVKKNSESNSNTGKSVKNAVKSVVDEDKRSKIFIIYGEPDAVTEDIESKVHTIFDGIFLHPRPQVLATSRIGTYKSLEEARPIKVTLGSSEAVKNVLSRSRRLKLSRKEELNKIYLASDRNKEERAIHHKLVLEMKKLIVEQPNKHHCVRNCKVVSVDKT